MTESIVVVLSGGMDSTAALYRTLATYGPKHTKAISFNYGQRHNRELEAAANICSQVEVEHKVVDIRGINQLLGGSALTDDVSVPEGHYAHESMRVTVVPNRNAIMANIAAAWAISNGGQFIVMGMHAGDHPVYPDCRPEAVEAMQESIRICNDSPNFGIWTPWINLSKADIVTQGNFYFTPWDLTWTCYNGGQIHCGRCSTCIERLEAFHIAGAEDMVEYADDTYWREVVNA